jgi:hypothetical protein
MGIAAYNRGSRAIARQLAAGARPVEFEVMERLNSLEKYPDAGKPFGPIQFVFAHRGVWAQCPKTGFGFPYPTLAEAVKRWRVTIVAFDQGKWMAQPHK